MPCECNLGDSQGFEEFFEKYFAWVRIPAHRDHPFRPNVITNSGILITDSGHHDHGFR